MGRHYAEYDDYFFNQLVNCVEEGLWKVNQDGQTEFVNQRVSDMTGYTREELLQKSLFDLIPPEDHETTRAMVRPEVGSLCVERPFIRADGTKKWFRVTTSPVFDKNGAFSGRVGVLSDISTEKQLRAEYDRFFSESLDLLGIAGTDGYFKNLNPAFERTLGWSILEMLARPYLEFVHPDDRKNTTVIAAQMNGGLEIQSFENRYMCKDGSYRWLSWKSSSPQGGVVYFVARDVTEQKKLTQALRVSAQMQAGLSELGHLALKASQLQQVFERAVHLISEVLDFEICVVLEVLPGGDGLHLVVQKEGGGLRAAEPPMKMEFSELNRFALESSEAVVIEDFAFETRFPADPQLLHAGVSGGMVIAIMDVEKPYGLFAAYTSRKRNYGPEDVHFFSAVSHILSTAVERWRLEAKLKSSDRMATVGVLAAGVAHEINNPLSYVITNLDLLAGKLAPSFSSGESAELLPMVHQAQEGAERVRQVVKDLKTFSSQSNDLLSPVDLRSVVELSARMAANHLRYRAGVKTDFQTAPVVLADPNRMAQVVLNILINAAQAIPDGHSDKNQVGLYVGTNSSGMAILEVTDTGTGIAPEDLPRIFDPFFTTKPVGVGTGLGLSICRNIITKLGGDISIESRLGFGTKVRIVLPPAPKQRQTAAPMVEAVAFPEPHVSRRVLILDDEASLVQTLGKALSRQHDVNTTTSPKEALEILRSSETEFDIVFCDLMMSEMTGMDFFEELKRIKPEVQERVVFMTGGAFTEEARRFLEEVPNIRIEKPFNLKDIRELIQTSSNRKK